MDQRNFTGYPVRKIMILRNGYSQVVSKDYYMHEGEPASQLKARAIFWHKAMDRYFQTGTTILGLPHHSI